MMMLEKSIRYFEKLLNKRKLLLSPLDERLAFLRNAIIALKKRKKAVCGRGVMFKRTRERGKFIAIGVFECPWCTIAVGKLDEGIQHKFCPNCGQALQEE